MAKSLQPDTHSLRIFGLIWAAVFTVLAVWPLLKGGDARIWAAAVSAVFVVITIAYPRLFSLTQFYQGWVKLGEVLGFINSRIIMVLMFVVIFVPVGLLFRVMRRDPLHRKPDAQATSYFIKRETQPGSMQRQF
jgi:uncharacterized membrane protein